MLEIINLQASPYGGSTINLYAKDLVSARILDDAIGRDAWIVKSFPIDIRLGHVIDGCDRWWKPDEEGIGKLVADVNAYGLPFFERIRPLSGQVEFFRKGRFVATVDRLDLAIALHRLGDQIEACKILTEPQPKLIPPWTDYMLALRRRIGCPPSV